MSADVKVGDLVRVTHNGYGGLGAGFAPGTTVRVKEITGYEGPEYLACEHLDGSDWWYVGSDEYDTDVEEEPVSAHHLKVKVAKIDLGSGSKRLWTKLEITYPDGVIHEVVLYQDQAITVDVAESNFLMDYEDEQDPTPEATSREKAWAKASELTGDYDPAVTLKVAQWLHGDY